MVVSKTSGLSPGAETAEDGIPQSKGYMKTGTIMAWKRRFMRNWDSGPEVIGKPNR